MKIQNSSAGIALDFFQRYQSQNKVLKLSGEADETLAGTEEPCGRVPVGRIQCPLLWHRGLSWGSSSKAIFYSLSRGNWVLHHSGIASETGAVPLASLCSQVCDCPKEQHWHIMSSDAAFNEKLDLVQTLPLACCTQSFHSSSGYQRWREIPSTPWPPLKTPQMQ